MKKTNIILTKVLFLVLILLFSLPLTSIHANQGDLVIHTNGRYKVLGPEGVTELKEGEKILGLDGKINFLSANGDMLIYNSFSGGFYRWRTDFAGSIKNYGRWWLSVFSFDAREAIEISTGRWGTPWQTEGGLSSGEKFSYFKSLFLNVGFVVLIIATIFIAFIAVKHRRTQTPKKGKQENGTL
jgi:hypothetical protein